MSNTKVNKQEQIEIRNKLSSEVKNLEFQEKKIQAELKTKRAELKRVCPCEDREDMYEYSVCKHCGETH